MCRDEWSCPYVNGAKIETPSFGISAKESLVKLTVQLFRTDALRRE